MRTIPRYLTSLGAAAALLAVTACSSQKPSDAPAVDHPPASATTGTTVNATFGKDDAAVVYDKALVPENARILVAENIHEGATTVTLSVHGLLPNRVYGAHAHAKPCGPTGDAAGPHFQHQPDPVTPSVNPAFANPANEIWLDFRTDPKGNATAAATVEWLFTNARAGSVVVHAEPTQTAPGKAGVAGARAACVSVSF